MSAVDVVKEQKEYRQSRKDQWDIDYKIMMKRYEDQGTVL